MKLMYNSEYIFKRLLQKKFSLFIYNNTRKKECYSLLTWFNLTET